MPAINSTARAVTFEFVKPLAFKAAVLKKDFKNLIEDTISDQHDYSLAVAVDRNADSKIQQVWLKTVYAKHKDAGSLILTITVDGKRQELALNQALGVKPSQLSEKIIDILGKTRN